MLPYYVYDGLTETSLQWQVTDFHMCLSSSARRLISRQSSTHGQPWQQGLTHSS
jgi:hypothetical protein